MTFRPAPLKAAAALAAGFVVVRVIYRVLFHGADGSGPVLLALPEVRLPAPFAHVVMLGPVTTGGLWDAAASALPIAALILVFGLLNALFDVARLFARGSRRGPLRGIARTLGIAWATLPALADAVRSVRFAQRLRGERGGVRLLAPVLEHTLERATAVAAALELRGLAGRPVDGDCAAPVSVRGADLTHRGGAGIHIDALALTAGTLTVLSGPTGSGKSTLLRTLSGLHTHLDGGDLTGTVRVVGHERTAVPPRDSAQLIGVVLQHPREAFTTERVADEIGLALELRGVAPSIIASRVAEIAERVGIPSLLARRLRGLSAGEATLVAIAAAIVEHPILLLVDEPLADLDASYRRRVIELLGALAHEAGVCVVVAEHRGAELRGVADRSIRMSDGRLDSGDDLAVETPRYARTSPIGDPVLQARGLTVRRGSAIAVDEATISVRAGEIVALVGPNGAGKSSLLEALAVPPAGADITVDGVRAARGVALVPDASDDLFTSDTVAAECRRADRRARASAGSTSARFAGFIGWDAGGPEFARLRMQHPRDLSVGQRRALALALQLATSPRVLLVDEPTRGLDGAARDLVARALVARADEGAAVLVATHDADFAAALAGRIVPMADGRLGEQVPVLPPHRAQALHRTQEGSSGLERPARLSERAPIPNLDPPEYGSPASAHPRPSARSAGPLIALLAANAAALAAFCWPLVASALPAQAQAAVPVMALALIPLAAIVVLGLLDGTVRSAHSLALLGVLAAIGAAIRIAGTGVGGVEAVFVLLILAGRAYGARFGLLLGMLTIALSSVVSGGIGPWTPFQMFACGWVGAGAGLLPRLRGWAEVALLSVYGVVGSYAFGLIMNLWFWPFAVGGGTGISYEPGAPLPTNLASFLLYSLVTSTATWDTLRAITSVIGIVVVGRAVLSALRRAKPVAGSVRPRSTSPRGGGTRRHPSTAPDAAAVPR
ncbi:ATP-binding cassette domain-containing protein [Microbacterium rhizomatis]|uniref:ATP-binding cassette domain-containing protein n=1 Tax=Microbacterium rhizomatis TaxID=1631477 RepID=A0A5J5J5Q0_9MICO|nr:ATP-binding cassette domain-containing protein [Microbacterium rhizomatis]KAA9111476.1 ATP-binding cassette domain-containing protein [Microbacterium rhizomatis]